MTTRSNLLLLALGLSTTLSVQAQSNKSIEQATRPRTVTPANTAAAKPEQQVNQQTTTNRTAQPTSKKAANHFQQDEARVAAKENRMGV
jgi:hypothetical protein